MAWSGEEDHVQVIFLDQPVEVNVGKRQTGTCSPVSEKPVLDVLRLEGFLQQGIVLQIDHAKARGNCRLASRHRVLRKASALSGVPCTVDLALP